MPEPLPPAASMRTVKLFPLNEVLVRAPPLNVPTPPARVTLPNSTSDSRISVKAEVVCSASRWALSVTTSDVLGVMGAKDASLEDILGLLPPPPPHPARTRSATSTADLR